MTLKAPLTQRGFFCLPCKVGKPGLIQQNETVTNVIQVCYDLTDPGTKKWEIEGLHQACMAHRLNKGLLISHDQTGTIPHQKIQIEILPLADYLLDRKEEV